MSIETVVIVHGTFSRDASWWKNDSDFCRGLDAALEATGSSARCWAHLPLVFEEEFSWSGRNSEIDRRREAAYLLAYLISIAMADEVTNIHVVAHSHGGNLVYHALNSPGFHSFLSYKIASVTFLGTPFLKYSSFARKLKESTGTASESLYRTAIGERMEYTGKYHGLNASDCYCIYFENDEAFHLLSHAKEIEASPERYGYSSEVKFVSALDSYIANFHRISFCHGRRLAKYVEPKNRYAVPLVLGMTAPWNGPKTICQYFSLEKQAIRNVASNKRKKETPIGLAFIVAVHVVTWPIRLTVAIVIWLFDFLFLSPLFYISNRIRAAIARAGIKIFFRTILAGKYTLDRLVSVSRSPPYVHGPQLVELNSSLQDEAAKLVVTFVESAAQKLYGLSVPPADDILATNELGASLRQIFTDPALLHCQYYAHPEVTRLIASFVKTPSRRENLYNSFRKLAHERLELNRNPPHPQSP